MDIVWIRASYICNVDKNHTRQNTRTAKELGFNHDYKALDQHLAQDYIYFEVAFMMLKNSWTLDVYSNEYKQFILARQIRTWSSNVYKICLQAYMLRYKYKMVPREVTQFSSWTSQSRFFARCIELTHIRMGKESRSYVGISQTIMVKLPRQYKEELSGDKLWVKEKGDTDMNFFVCILCSSSVRQRWLYGGVAEIIEAYLDYTQLSNKIVSLLGRFKGKIWEQWHMLMVASANNSYLHSRDLVERGAKLLCIK